MDLLLSNFIDDRVVSTYNACATGTKVIDENRTTPNGIGESGVDQDGLFYHNSSVRIAGITDGTSNTIAIGEVQSDVDRIEDGAIGIDQRLDHWYFGSQEIDGDTTGASDFSEFVGSLGVGINLMNETIYNGDEYELSFGSHHTGGCHVLMADGAAKFISETIDATTRSSLGTRNGQEVMNSF